MIGLTKIEELISQMEPGLAAQEYVFATFKGAQYGDLTHLAPVAGIREKEGLTLVLERKVAESAGIPFQGVFRRISLEVHSSLEAVGLTAVVSAVLAENGISANIMAGYFHDHIFVPARQAEAALQLLKELK